jgi:hypothetical protein
MPEWFSAAAIDSIYAHPNVDDTIDFILDTGLRHKYSCAYSEGRARFG